MLFAFGLLTLYSGSSHSLIAWVWPTSRPIGRAPQRTPIQVENERSVTSRIRSKAGWVCSRCISE